MAMLCTVLQVRRRSPEVVAELSEETLKSVSAKITMKSNTSQTVNSLLLLKKSFFENILINLANLKKGRSKEHFYFLCSCPQTSAPHSPLDSALKHQRKKDIQGVSGGYLN